MLGDHTGHAAAVSALRERRVGLSGHAWFETFSVLTRLPSPQRRPAPEVASALLANFPETRWLPEAAAGELSRRCAALGIAGGAIYDALVAATSIHHQLALLTGDARAIATYRALGAQIEFIA